MHREQNYINLNMFPKEYSKRTMNTTKNIEKKIIDYSSSKRQSMNKYIHNKYSRNNNGSFFLLNMKKNNSKNYFTLNNSKKWH